MKKYYSHIITACAFLIMFVNVGFPSTSFGVYQPYIVDVPGMSHSDGSFVVTIRNFSSLVTIFFLAWYFKLLDCRMGIFLGTLATAIGFGVYSISYNLITFSIGSIISGIGYGFAGTTAMTILIGRWHGKNTGTPFGIATIGSSASGFIVPMVVLGIVSAGSLGQAFGVQAVFALASALLLLLFVRNNTKTKKNNMAAKVNKSEKQPLSKKQYYLFVFAVVLLGGSCLSDIVFLSVLFSTEGADPFLAASVVSVVNLSLAAGKFILGVVLDKIGTYKGTIIAFVALLVGKLMICFTASMTGLLPYISTAIFGLGTAVLTVGIAQWCIDLSTESTRNKAVRDIQVAYNTGGFLTAMIPGIIAELTGSYVPFYFGSAVVFVITAIIIVKLLPKK